MGLDIRLPIGLFFSLLGVLLAAFGLLGNKEIYQRSLGIDVNLAWGVVLLIFGIIMIVLAKRRTTQAGPRSSENASHSPGGRQ
jgi:multisubunit Na+/H+ antiporter MnhG subunit